MFLAALIAVVGMSASVMAAASFAGGTISPNSGSLSDVLSGNSKVATITGTGLVTADVPAGSLQLKRASAPNTVVALTIVGFNAAGTEVYVTIADATGGNAGVYNLEFDPDGAGVAPFAAVAGITYELRRENNNLQVKVRMTLKARADITFAAGTGNVGTGVGGVDGFDDNSTSYAADNITAFQWIVRDADLSTAIVAGGAGYNIDISVGGVPSYISSDPANGNKLISIKNVSKTNNTVDLYAQATDAYPAAPVNASDRWTLVAAVGAPANQFSLAAAFSGPLGTSGPLSHVAPVTPNKDNLAINTVTNLVLTVVPPSAIAAPVVAGIQYTSTVQITAVPQ